MKDINLGFQDEEANRQLSINQAASDFEHAKNRASLQNLVGWLTGRNYDLVDYNKVRSKLGSVANRLPELREIPLDAIVGSVSRSVEFSRTFLPRMDSDKYRWANVKIANDSMEGVPPIDVYQIGEVYFVLDGHHRISVMRDIGAEYILANVQVINTDVPLKPEDSPDEIITKVERQNFFEKTHADTILPKVKLELKMPDQYPRLLEHILVHRYYMGQARGHEISMKEALLDWYAKVYLPVIRVIRMRNLLAGFQNETETSLYLWIQEHMAELEEEYGENLRPDSVAWSLAGSFSKTGRQIKTRIKNHLFSWLQPGLIDWDVQTGEWRESHNWHDSAHLIRRMLVTVSNLQDDMEYLRSAIRFGARMDSWVGIVHVVRTKAAVDSEDSQTFIRTAEQMLNEEGVRGKVYVLAGNTRKIVSERAFWSDVTLMRMKHRPPLNMLGRLSSSWVWIFRNVPGLIVAIPETISRRNRNLLLAFDQSPRAREAMYFAGALCKNAERSLTVVISGDDEMKKRQAFGVVSDYYSSLGLKVNYEIDEDSPARTILRTVEKEHTDVIIMGGYSEKKLQRLFTPSTVDRVLAETTIPVLVCK